MWRSGGAARGIRTPDPRITNAVLYRLSYCGVKFASLIPGVGRIGKQGGGRGSGGLPPPLAGGGGGGGAACSEFGACPLPASFARIPPPHAGEGKDRYLNNPRRRDHPSGVV